MIRFEFLRFLCCIVEMVCGRAGHMHCSQSFLSDSPLHMSLLVLQKLTLIQSCFCRNEFAACMYYEHFLFINTTRAYMFTLNILTLLYGVCPRLIQPKLGDFWEIRILPIDKDEEREFIKDFHMGCRGPFFPFAPRSGWEGKIPSGIQQP